MTSADCAVFKPYIVSRPGSACQVLFPLAKLDELVDAACVDVQAKLKAARDDNARLREMLMAIKSRAELGIGIAILEDEAENFQFIIELVEAALAGGPR